MPIMKLTNLTGAVRTAALSLVATLLGFWAMAQDNGGDGGAAVTVTKTSTSHTENWYTAPWVWIVGAAIFILLLIALVRGGSSRTTTTRITKSTD
jgi:hypothetical protein